MQDNQEILLYNERVNGLIIIVLGFLALPIIIGIPIIIFGFIYCIRVERNADKAFDEEMDRHNKGFKKLKKNPDK